MTAVAVTYEVPLFIWEHISNPAEFSVCDATTPHPLRDYFNRATNFMPLDLHQYQKRRFIMMQPKTFHPQSAFNTMTE